ncbi:hypothetical protein EsVE80_14180 [Enterococcus saigonensis]|uniref:Uncharacterized protein n=1 Tax=Enterococcus saigonensis TaxID=1805431 RepID=A0A679IK33_9ENTE|nr:hypothetical protein EsVE80_14180 [Enterococcus saigonensis]
MIFFKINNASHEKTSYLFLIERSFLSEYHDYNIFNTFWLDKREVLNKKAFLEILPVLRAFFGK